MPKFLDKTVLTFDCYGTMIDWETGIWNVLGPVLAHHNKAIGKEETLELFGVMETQVEAGPYMTYRNVLATVLRRIGGQLGFQPDDEEISAFAVSVGDWPEFPDSTDALLSLRKRFRLAVITNCEEIHLLDFRPEPGTYTLQLECAGKNLKSGGYYCGLESVRLRERRPRVAAYGHDKDKDWRARPNLYR